MSDLQACLPPELRGPATTITKIAAGLSGAGVYRVDAAGRAFVLKISDEREPLEPWRKKLHARRLAADARLAPRVVHADEARRAIVSDFVADRSFAAFFGDPRTRPAALQLLANTLRGVHALPLPPDATPLDVRARLAALSPELAGFALPRFVREAVADALAADPPAATRPLALCHNDVNPTNLVYDGERLLLLDWEAAGANDPYFDVAAISVFLRLDDTGCRALVAAYDRAPPEPLPPRFLYLRRLVAVLCGALFLNLARLGGHAGSDGETAATAPTLLDVHQRMRAGTLDLAKSEGRFTFGLALVKEASALS